MRALSAILILAGAISCAGSSSGPTCVRLGEGECIDSPECTLLPASDQPADYACVAARNACEEGFIQRDATAGSCEKTTGCRFVPAQCYCAPDRICVCGGGPPAQCVPDTSLD